mmetsp:Transcript_29428/g.51594  ORF Transcript_29428/g.51594 Transcript_29428/m.51594 type:complete len:656 (-) Transcript_29428:13-1980(-)
MAWTAQLFRVKFACMKVGEYIFFLVFVMLVIGFWFTLNIFQETLADWDFVEIVPLVLSTYIWHFVVQCIAGHFRTQQCMRQKIVLLTYYGPMYFVFGFLLFQYTFDFINRDIWRLSVEEGCAEAGAVAFLRNQTDYEETGRLRIEHPCLNTNCNSLADESLREQCVSMSRETSMPKWLRSVPLLTPVFAWFSFLVGLYQMIRHSRKLWKYAVHSEPWLKHDTVIQITTLPTVYSILSFKALLRSFEVIYSSYGKDELCYAQITQQLSMTVVNSTLAYKAERCSNSQWKFYLADFAMADLYEAWALLRFGRLKFNRIKEEHKATRDAWQKYARSNTKLRVYEQGEQIYQPMAKSTEAILYVCIYAFIFSCVMNSGYEVTDLLMYLYNESLYKVCSSYLEKAHYFMLGFGFVTSTMAIYAIIQIETSFHRELDGFNPWWKFLSCKILVSLAFLQEGICLIPMPGVGGGNSLQEMTDTQSNMFYAACLCYESFLVSLFCLQAWRASEKWYDDDTDLAEKKGTKFQSLLDKYSVEIELLNGREAASDRYVKKCTGVYTYIDSHENRPKFENAASGAIMFWRSGKWMINHKDDVEHYHFYFESDEEHPPCAQWDPAESLPSSSGCTVRKEQDMEVLNFDRRKSTAWWLHDVVGWGDEGGA